MDIASLQSHYNGYTARSSDGPVKLYNPLSVMEALTRNCVEDFWAETGTVIGLIALSNLTSFQGSIPHYRKCFGVLALTFIPNLVARNCGIEYR